MLLVVVGAVTLVIGVFFGSDDNLTLIYVSIAACLLAGLFLVAGILRNRPSRKPVLGSDGAEATWSGATAWPGAGGAEAPRAAAPAVLEREQEPAHSEVQIVTARPDTGGADEAIADEPTSAGLARAEEDEDEDVVVVPKRAAEPIAERAEAPARKAAAKKAPAKKAAAKKTAAKKTAAKQTTAKQTTAKKAAPAKKAAAKKTAAKKVTPPAKKATKKR